MLVFPADAAQPLRKSRIRAAMQHMELHSDPAKYR
jgi:hypothetical protein